ncbi:phosphatase PAP2 family protein [uncultured Bacteroides sp.]|uniref:phosphatase PAP2 family protein n=1 Tax=uncultured Bacteroides sp. TaxID=162156 RepID=UPI002AAB97A0|nr:phosphatase PAP2 family protein [uncultured Bacteroides sp.]
MKIFFISLFVLLLHVGFVLAENPSGKLNGVLSLTQKIALEDIYTVRKNIQKTSVGFNQPFYGQADTLNNLSSKESFKMKLDKITSSRAYRMTYISIPLIAVGLIVKGEDDHFRSLRNEYLPSFQQHYDNYLQYFPAVAMIGMKIGGVKGRSSWERMLVSDAFSAAIMAATVNTLKSSTKVMRPDGSNNKSFPSGHTATAFMAATMMHKEYGLTRSPWYSIGAYSVATITGLTRQLNNKHWLSDIMVGAGVGVLSTEVGYYLADLLFKDKGISYSFLEDKPLDRFNNPSFLGLYLGINSLPGKYKVSNGSYLSTSTGSNAGVEGAWFMNPYLGMGGRFTVSSMPTLLNEIPQNDPLDIFSGSVGAYFSYPITTRWSVGSKLLAGYTHFPKCKLSSIEIGRTGGVSLGTGCSLNYLAKQNLGIRFFMDYDLLPSPIPLNNHAEHQFTLGGAVNVLF